MARAPDHLIAPGVHGFLENPPADVIAPDCLFVSGWAFASGAEIREVWVTGLGVPRPVQYGILRDDIPRFYPGEPGAARSGFTAYLEFEGGAGPPVAVEIWAALSTGQSIRLFKRRLVPLEHGDEPSPVLQGARHVLRHPRVLFQREAWLHLAGLMAAKWLPLPGQAMRPVNDPTDRKTVTRTARTFLDNFLASRSPLVLPTSSTPVVTVAFVVCNRAELTFMCFRALMAQRDVPMEVVIVDNASTDETAEFLSRVHGITVIRNDSNLGFSTGNNIGARSARGEFLLFLNNDADLMPGAIRQLVDTARRDPAIGAVGGKLVFPDGRLQEAGSIIWGDGSCQGYGRGGDPTAGEYNFERDVDFTSGALLLTPRRIFEQLEGFDERYKPMYYEDADYCARLWKNGYRVRYQPKAIAVHHEYGSAATPIDSIRAQRARQPIFFAQHRDWLGSHLPRSDRNLPAARLHPHGRPAVLLIDDSAPDPRMGSGFPRAAALVDALLDLGYVVTIYATDGQWCPVWRGPATVEVVTGSPSGLNAFIAERRHYQLVVVSRPDNMRYLKAAVGVDLSALGAPCIYDAEAAFAVREIGRRRLEGPPMSDEESRALIEGEAALTKHCAAVLTVSDGERRVFAGDAGRVFIVSHAVATRPTPASFADRRSILFVGGFAPGSPNDDTVSFLCRDVVPALRALGCDAPVVIVGARIPDRLKALAAPGVSFHSDVDDVTPFYDEARVFVAPTRYAAGIPLKIIETAARGVPVVCTPLVAGQLGWTNGQELVAAEGAEGLARSIVAVFGDAALWQRLREGGLKRVAREYSPDVFREAVKDAIAVVRRAPL